MPLSENEVLSQSRKAFAQWESQWREHAVRARAMIDAGKAISQKAYLNYGIGKQLLICATGVSLEDQFDALASLNDGTDVFCVDKSFGFLVNAGITPKYCVLADANVSFDQYCKPYLDMTTDTTLFASVCSNPEWFENWKGPVVFYVNKDNIQSEKIFIEISGCREVIPASSNVGNTAVVLGSILMMYDRYLLLGYDFAWYPQRNYYAFHDTEKRYWMRGMYQIDYTGELCYTSGNLQFSARWLRDFLTAECKRPVFNCSNGGLLGWNPAKLETMLRFEPRVWTAGEKDAYFNSQIEARQIQFRGDMNAVTTELSKEKYIAGITLHYLPETCLIKPEAA